LCDYIEIAINRKKKEIGTPPVRLPIKHGAITTAHNNTVVLLNREMNSPPQLTLLNINLSTNKVNAMHDIRRKHTLE